MDQAQQNKAQTTQANVDSAKAELIEAQNDVEAAKQTVGVNEQIVTNK